MWCAVAVLDIKNTPSSLWARPQNCEKRLLASSCPSVRPYSACLVALFIVYSVRL